MAIHVRRIAPGEGQLLRDIRLRALADSPAAFGETLASALARSDADWEAAARDRASSLMTSGFIAIDAGRWIGITGCYFEEDAPETGVIVSVWVDPAYRGRQVAYGLMGKAACWAAEQGAARLDLWVTEGNAPAIRLYEKLGFADTGDRTPHPSQPGLVEARYQAALAAVLGAAG